MTIPSDKPYIILKGENKRKTQIVWDDHDSLAQSPTFASFADNIIAKSITFVVIIFYIYIKPLICSINFV